MGNESIHVVISNETAELIRRVKVKLFNDGAMKVSNHEVIRLAIDHYIKTKKVKEARTYDESTTTEDAITPTNPTR